MIYIFLYIINTKQKKMYLNKFKNIHNDIIIIIQIIYFYKSNFYNNPIINKIHIFIQIYISFCSQIYIQYKFKNKSFIYNNFGIFNNN